MISPFEILMAAAKQKQYKTAEAIQLLWAIADDDESSSCGDSSDEELIEPQYQKVRKVEPIKTSARSTVNKVELKSKKVNAEKKRFAKKVLPSVDLIKQVRSKVKVQTSQRIKTSARSTVNKDELKSKILNAEKKLPSKKVPPIKQVKSKVKVQTSQPKVSPVKNGNRVSTRSLGVRVYGKYTNKSKDHASPSSAVIAEEDSEDEIIKATPTKHPRSQGRVYSRYTNKSKYLAEEDSDRAEQPPPPKRLKVVENVVPTPEKGTRVTPRKQVTPRKRLATPANMVGFNADKEAVYEFSLLGDDISTGNAGNSNSIDGNDRGSWNNDMGLDISDSDGDVELPAFVIETDSSNNDGDGDDNGVVTHQVVLTKQNSAETKTNRATDRKNGWVGGNDHGDQTPNMPDFTGLGPGHNMHNLVHNTPEEFFKEMFDDKMWTIMSEATNQYVEYKKNDIRKNRDPFEAADVGEPNLTKGSRLNQWTNTTPNEMKVFVAHLIIMGLIKKPSLESYWSRESVTRTSFFGTYMPRNRFQNILWNLHVSPSPEVNPPYGEEGHDPLYKVREMLDMMGRNFKTKYTPGKIISMDESCCPFKGRVRFLQYMPKKPNKFSIKLWMISEATTGYISGFEVYTGRELTVGNDIDGTMGRTTKLVVGLLQSLNLTDSGYHLYFDNYFNSPELVNALYKRKTLCCGTVNRNRKNLPKAVIKQKLDRGESIYARRGEALALKWRDKREVMVLSSIHSCREAISNKKNFRGERKMKPAAVYYYNQNMSGVDLTDQFLTYYSFLRKTLKWYRKLLIHFLNMTILNAHLLHKMYGNEKMSHEHFRHAIVHHLLKSGKESVILDVPSDPLLGLRIVEENHFAEKIPPKKGAQRQNPCRSCFVCNISQADMDANNYNQLSRKKKKSTSYWCPKCQKPLCVDPCFKLFHTEENYVLAILKIREDNYLYN
jgi:hypothetical protein